MIYTKFFRKKGYNLERVLKEVETDVNNYILANTIEQKDVLSYQMVKTGKFEKDNSYSYECEATLSYWKD